MNKRTKPLQSLVAPELLPPMFSCLPSAVRTELIDAGEIRTFKKAELLWSETTPVQEVAIVVSGCFGVCLRNTDEESLCPIAAHARGGVLARSLTERLPALNDVRALVSSTALILPLDKVRLAALTHPEVLERFVEYRTVQVHWGLYMAHQLGRTNTEKRLAHVLWALSRVNANGKRAIDFKLGQAELAHLAGTDRSETSRRLRDLVQAGYLKPLQPGYELTKAFGMLLAFDAETPAFVLDGLRRQH